MTVGSLFAGIGGFDLAATRVGWDVHWQVEIDPFCRRVLENELEAETPIYRARMDALMNERAA